MSDGAPALPLLPSRAEMERAYRASDTSYDGIFYLGVRTTGVFCRPSCPSRKARPEHIEFFQQPAEAVEAGYRPCRRCQPLSHGEAPPWAGRLLDRIDAHPDARIREQDLRALGLEPARVRRYFLARYGLTFQAYCRARRLGRAFERLRAGESLDETVFETGYESHSGFREAFAQAFGASPRGSSAARCIRLDWLNTPLGRMVAGATEQGLCLLEFTEPNRLELQLERLRRRFAAALVPAPDPTVQTLRTELAEYFSGQRQVFSIPIEAPGTPFEARVWQALRQIPYGETRSYTDMARALGQPGAMRAVGRANGRNRVAIVIPCHRVVNSGGGLGGYGGGLWRKRYLLNLESGNAVIRPSAPTSGR